MFKIHVSGSIILKIFRILLICGYFGNSLSFVNIIRNCRIMGVQYTDCTFVQIF